METKRVNLLKIINDAPAIYSSEFASLYEEPFDLLDLIIENSDTASKIIVGMMVFEKTSDDSIIVIDGLKRLVAISLLLHSICECYKLTNDKNTKAINKIKQKYLFGKYGTKLQLVDYNKEIYEKIVNYEKLTSEEKDCPIFKTLHDFWVKIKKNNLSANILFKQIKKMDILVMSYDKTEVNDLDLYQFLNFNNKNTDSLKMITSFVKTSSGNNLFMWGEILFLFKSSNLDLLIIPFLKNFLTIQKNGTIPNDNDLYMSFKSFYNRINCHRQPVEIFKMIEKAAINFIKLSCADFSNYEIKKLITVINENNMHETYPYLLELMEDYTENRVTDEMLIEILRTIIDYVNEKTENKSNDIFSFANLSYEINQRIY